jgi:DNA (cytosine-5)-methyltransferase 1
MLDGKEVALKPAHGLKMQGFPDWFKFSVSDTQAMKQLGNSVAVDAIRAVGRELIVSIGEGE